MQSLTIVGNGPDLAADLYLPSVRHGLVPAVVAGSGFGGVKEMLLPAFARALADAGIATLLVDFAGFGGSAGEPRQHIEPRAQIRDLRRGLDYLALHEAVDPARLGVWGPSMCGAHALVLAGTDPRVRAAVSLIPFVRAPRLPPKPKVTAHIALDVVRRLFGFSASMIAAAGGPSDRAVMTTDGALDWILGISTEAPTFRNEVTTRSLLQVAAYRPVEMIGLSGIQVPLRTILAASDSLTPASLVRSALQKAAKDADIVEFPGTHFELFAEHLPKVIRLTVEWFTEHLKPARVTMSGPDVSSVG